MEGNDIDIDLLWDPNWRPLGKAVLGLNVGIFGEAAGILNMDFVAEWPLLGEGLRSWTDPADDREEVE